VSRPLQSLCLLPLLAALAAPPQREAALNFVHLSDTHVVEPEGVAAPLALERGHLVDGAENLSGFLEVMSAPESGPYRPAFFLITGDLVDAFRYSGDAGRDVGGQVEAFAASMKKSGVPVYLALGNHDILRLTRKNDATEADHSAAREARLAWSTTQACFRNGTYYAFERRVGATTYAFLVLDNSEEPAQEQIDWLARQVRARPGAVIVLALHVPLGDDEPSRSIRSALARARVALVLAGHTHGSLVRRIDLGAGGAVEVRTAAFSANPSNWRRIRLYPNRIAVYGTGEPDRVEMTVPLAQPSVKAR
jgi:predicted MPP superfamily phosphohydrolase